jgi:hypothetical protein
MTAMRIRHQPSFNRRDLLGAVVRDGQWSRPADSPAGEPRSDRAATTTPGWPVAPHALGEVLLERRAHRFYADEPVPASVVEGALDSAGHCDRLVFPDGTRRGLALEFLVIPNRVDGLERRFLIAAGSERRQLGPMPLEADLTELVLQVEYAAAPVIVMAIGSLEQALDVVGPAGHRYLLARAGASLQGAWLHVASLGYVGSIFAGLVPAALGDIAGVDGYGRLGLLAFSFGRPLGS